MENKHYPTGNEILDPAGLITTPVVTDVVELIRSNRLNKSITVQNLFKQAGIANGQELALIVSGAIDPSLYTFVTLNSTTPKIEATIAAPVAGKFLVITQIDAGTAGHTVTLTAGTWNGSNAVATFNAQLETLVLFGITATRFAIVLNLGTVAFSG